MSAFSEWVDSIARQQVRVAEASRHAYEALERTEWNEVSKAVAFGSSGAMGELREALDELERLEGAAPAVRPSAVIGGKPQ